MLTLLCHRTPPRPCAAPSHFYRIDVTDNLFGEYTVVREWGRTGAQGARVCTWFANLRDAIIDADRCARRMRRRGYALTETVTQGAG